MPTSTTTTTTSTSFAVTHFANNQASRNIQLEKEEEEEEEGGGEGEKLSHECRELLHSLPKEKGWRTRYLYKYQGFWCQSNQIQSIMCFQKHFQARDSDVVLATIPKSGTTWLKALAFAILNRKRFPASDKNHPLVSTNPHDLVPFFEYKLYTNYKALPDLSKVGDEPRIFATHVPFASLQESIKKSNCRIVYICRNPFDTFISSWIFLNKLRPENQPPVSIEEGLEKYCRGVIGFGPFWEHMLGYWKESLERPGKVLFLTYEDMKEDITYQLKKLAKFLGCPFTTEEDREGTIGEIAKLCSFEKLKEFEVNKSGKSILNSENRHLFRKAEVGDWMNYFSPSMADQLTRVMEEKLGASGLRFKGF